MINNSLLNIIITTQKKLLTDIQASLANSQLKKLDKFIARRRELVDNYVSWMEQLPYIQRAQMTNIDYSANHIFPVKIDFKSIDKSRNEIMNYFRKKSIITQVHYIPVVNQPYYRKLGNSPNDFQNSQNYYSETLSLPLYFGMTDQQQDYLFSQVEKLFEI